MVVEERQQSRTRLVVVQAQSCLVVLVEPKMVDQSTCHRDLCHTHSWSSVEQVRSMLEVVAQSWMVDQSSCRLGPCRKHSSMLVGEPGWS